MLRGFGKEGAINIGPSTAAADLLWVDCLQPTRAEELMLEKLLKVELPTPEERREREVSNRMNDEGGTLTMTVNLVSKSDSAAPENTPVTFILTATHLITLRYDELRSFINFSEQFQKVHHYNSSQEAFLGLLEHIIERLTDVLEHVGTNIEGISADLFGIKAQLATQPPYPMRGKRKRSRNSKPRELLNRVGAIGNLDGKVRESLVSCQRLINFMYDSPRWSPEVKQHLKIHKADLQALCEHSYFLADKITFLLDAVLGLINIEQNDIIRIFSIAAVMFMPPTLIASIYGMNFKHMHELNWDLGYEYALMLMLLSTFIPYLFFKKKGWM